jgi:C-terminal duplication domain of Friend of PRMT1
VKPNLAQRIQNTPLVSVAPAPRAARGGRGRGRRGRGGLRGTGRRPKKTVDELDAEMTDYFQDNGTVATTTA